MGYLCPCKGKLGLLAQRLTIAEWFTDCSKIGKFIVQYPDGHFKLPHFWPPKSPQGGTWGIVALNSI
jgi:hypothetical protein